jgi:Ca2+-transporting ATPase
MAPAFVAGGIGVDWNAPNGSLSDPTHNDPSKSSAALWEGKVQIHPSTDPSDDAYKLFGDKP